MSRLVAHTCEHVLYSLVGRNDFSRVIAKDNYVRNHKDTKTQRHKGCRSERALCVFVVLLILSK
jgi:hypothetical protein